MKKRPSNIAFWESGLPLHEWRCPICNTVLVRGFVAQFQNDDTGEMEDVYDTDAEYQMEIIEHICIHIAEGMKRE